MAADLLIAASIDLSGEARFGSSHDRIVASLGLGKAGSVRFAEVEGNLLAARKELPAIDERGQSQASRFQPMQDDHGSYLLFAGRLEDRQELAAALGINPAQDDPSLYAYAYAQYGNDCDRRLNGDYAVIQWLAGKKLVRLARSATSTKPLHVWRREERLVVSSIPRALFAAGLRVEINQERLSDSLLLNYRDHTSSWYRDASRVACGTSQLHNRHGFAATTHWSADRVPAVQFARDEDYVEAVDEQFAKATRNAMDGLSRPAIAVSGGLDSQAVASYVCEHFGPGVPVPTFTSVPQKGWNPPPKPYSFGHESDHVRALAEMYPQITPHFVSAHERQFGSELGAMHLLGSWPMRNESNMHWIHEIYALAAHSGCQVMTFGGAGNTGFSYDGLTGYSHWLRSGQWGRLALELGQAADPRPYWRKAVSLAVMPNLPPALRKSLDRRRGRFSSAFETWCAMRQEFAQSSGALERAKSSGVDPEFYDLASALQWKAAVMSDTLSDNAEIDLAMQLHHGIGSRDPTLYRPLLELCVGIGDEQYLRDGTDRWLARRLLKGRIPETVRTERRFGRQSPDWAMRFETDRPAMLREVQSMKEDDLLSRVFDAERLSENLQTWSGTEDTAGINKLKINAAVGRAVSTSRFIRYVQNRNEAG